MTAHDQEDIFLYLSGDLTTPERTRVEDHLQACAECRELLAFVRDFNSTLRAIPPGELQPDTPCPDANTIAAFAARELDEGTARLVRKHTIFCRDCLREVFLLRRAAAAAGIKSTTESSEDAPRWKKVFERAKGLIIDLGKTYGAGFQIGPALIVAEQPMFATRGSQASKSASKVLEIAIGQNVYSVEVRVDEDRAVSFDIAGLRTPVKESLRVSVHSDHGEALASASGNQSGNCRFTVPKGSGNGNYRIVTFTLKEREQSFLLSLPET